MAGEVPEVTITRSGSTETPLRRLLSMAIGVAGLAAGERSLAGLHRRRGWREARLADLEVDDPPTLPLHGEGALHHLHGQERLDVAEPIGELGRHDGAS